MLQSSLPFFLLLFGSPALSTAPAQLRSSLQEFQHPSMLSTTFAAIVGHNLDPNNTLTYMNTKLGHKWYGPEEKNDFLLCECRVLI